MQKDKERVLALLDKQSSTVKEISLRLNRHDKYVEALLNELIEENKVTGFVTLNIFGETYAIYRRINNEKNI